MIRHWYVIRNVIWNNCVDFPFLRVNKKHHFALKFNIFKWLILPIRPESSLACFSVSKNYRSSKTSTYLSAFAADSRLFGLGRWEGRLSERIPLPSRCQPKQGIADDMCERRDRINCYKLDHKIITEIKYS